jgi:hypothetical protein
MAGIVIEWPLHKTKQDYTHSGGVFTCTTDGESVLPGVTYLAKHTSRLDFLHPVDCGAILSCVGGCDPNPRIDLLESGYECREV